MTVLNCATALIASGFSARWCADRTTITLRYDSADEEDQGVILGPRAAAEVLPDYDLAIGLGLAESLAVAYACREFAA